MFDWARSAGLDMLGGVDIYAYHRGASVRANFWAAGQAALDPDNRYTAGTTAPQPTSAAKTIVILPGFTEFCEKYSAEVRRFHDKGYNVLVIDWPGQGQSGHFGRHPLAVHCDDFDHHLGALDAVIALAGLDGHELVLFGHSMGGHLALRYAALRGPWVAGVILSAPMMAPPVMPVWLVRLASFFLGGVGLARSHPPFYRVLSLDWVRHYRPENVLTRNPKGYEDQFVWFDDAPELRRSGPTIGWVSAAYRSCALHTLNPDWLAALDVPVLAFIAGDERVVFAPSTHSSLVQIKNIETVVFEGARHELTRELPEVTDALWNGVDRFLARLNAGYEIKGL
ncbi:MAG: alpha/beta hydrolase [Candidatus Puniceispirillum sp.]|nr:alpha/beta hydrolase [Candidatus Puniceispirillum sp.]